MTTAPLRIDEDELATALRALLGPDAEPEGWVSEPVGEHVLHSITGGLHRLSGTAQGRPWSLVIKISVMRRDDSPGALWTGSEAPSHRNYWKREHLAYASGLLARLPGRLRAPRCLHATEPDERTAWLWLEDVGGTPGSRWGPERYPVTARDLGSTQGAFVTRRALPDHPWLSRGWLASWVDSMAQFIGILDEPSPWRDERLAPVRPMVGRSRALWERRHELLRIVDGAPRTLVHLDFWPPNLFSRRTADGAEETVAIDWSSVGIGALGQDLDQLALDPVWMQILDPAHLPALGREVLSGYLAGLHEAGCDAITADDVRRWYSAAGALKYAFWTGRLAQIAADPGLVASIERRFSRPFTDIVQSRTAVLGAVLDLADAVLG